MKRIPLTQGLFAIIDNEDYYWLNQWNWCALKDHRTFYAVRSVKVPKQIQFRMHRELIGPKPHQIVHHINGNGLDNRKSNLKVCTHKDNIRAQRDWTRKTSSRFKGICWARKRARWQAQIKVNGKRIWLGYFESEIDAAKSYDEAAKINFGEFAVTNKQLFGKEYSI